MDLNNMERGGLGKLKKFESDFDENAVWQSIESKKKRKPVFWIWMSGALFIAAVIGGLYVLNFDENSTQNIDNQFVEKQVVSENETVDKEVGIEKEQIIENLSLESVEERVTFSKEKIAAKSKSNVEQTSFSNQPEAIISDSELELFNEQIKQKDEALKLNDFQKDAELNFPANSEKANPKIQTKSIESIQSLPFATTVIETETKFDSDFKNLKDLPISIRKKNNLFVSVFSGIGYQIKSLNSKADFPNQEYIDLRNRHETVLESVTFGLDLDKKLTDRWFLGAGLEMVFHNEKLTISESRVEHIDDLAPEDVPADFEGQNGFLVRSKISEYHNQYRLLNAPIRLSYLIHFKKIRLLPEVGVVFNISQSAAGDIQNEEGIIMDLAPLYKTNVGVGYRGGCKFLVPIRNGFIVYAKSVFDFNPQNVATDDNLLIQKRSAIRLDLGLSRTF